MRLVAVAAAGLTALAVCSAAPAGSGDDAWQNAAARVTFPIYRPMVTLGFTLGPVVVERCFSPSYGRVRTSYSKGSGARRAVFGFEENYPQWCGDAGERMTVSSADVNGVAVSVAVYCRNPGPKCTVEDGFANGFHLELRSPGPKRTLIAVYSSGVALEDLLKVVRSLTIVPKPGTAPPPVSPSSGPCSMAEATRVVERLGLGNAADPDVAKPVAQVLCGAFFGPGSQAMVASLAIPSCGRTAGWVVFRRAGGAWQLVLSRNNGADLDAVGSGIRETMFVLRPGDAHCFPTGGTRSRTWRWNGARFTVSPWKQMTTGTQTAPAGAERSHYFKTPSGNIVCGYRDGTNTQASVGCRIKSGLKPPPPTERPGCFSRGEVFLRATGRVQTGRSICPGEDEGDAGVFAFESVAQVFAYGATWSGDGLRCTSAATGLTCRNRSGHGFFLSRERWRQF